MMSAFDIQTLLLSQIVSYALCVLVVSLLWYRNRRRFHGLGFWTADLVLQTVALVLVMLRDDVPTWASMVLASNALVIGGTLLLYAGLERFLGLRRRQDHNLVLLVSGVVVYALYTYVQPDLAARP